MSRELHLSESRLKTPFHHYPYQTHISEDGKTFLPNTSTWVRCPCGWSVGPMEGEAGSAAALAHIEWVREGEQA